MNGTLHLPLQLPFSLFFFNSITYSSWTSTRSSMISTNLFHLHFHGFIRCSVNLTFSSMLDNNTINFWKRWELARKAAHFMTREGRQVSSFLIFWCCLRGFCSDCKLFQWYHFSVSLVWFWCSSGSGGSSGFVSVFQVVVRATRTASLGRNQVGLTLIIKKTKTIRWTWNF